MEWWRPAQGMYDLVPPLLTPRKEARKTWTSEKSQKPPIVRVPYITN